MDEMEAKAPRSVICLIGALLAELHEQWEGLRYLSMEEFHVGDQGSHRRGGMHGGQHRSLSAGERHAAETNLQQKWDLIQGR